MRIVACIVNFESSRKRVGYINCSWLLSQVVHDTLSEFAPGTFNQTVLNGTESAPEIRLGTNTTTAQTWTFQDDDISGWTFTPGGNYLAEENPSGQIHVRAQYVSAESYGVASRGDVAVPNKFVAEYKVLFDSLQPSGVAGSDSSAAYCCWCPHGRS